MSRKPLLVFCGTASILSISLAVVAGEPQAADVSQPAVFWGGTVHDDEGRVVEGADVFVVAQYWNNRRLSNPYLISAVTDARGKWQSKLELTPAEFEHESCANVYLIVHKVGHGCDFVRFPSLSHDEVRNGIVRLSPRNLETVLPSERAMLSVKAVKGGAPQASTVIRIANEHWPKFYPESLKPSGNAGGAERLEEILYPAARTDDQGIAYFDDLAPGTYRILVSDRDSDYLQIIQVDPEGQMRSPDYQGVPLRAREARAFTVAVYEQSNRAPIQVLQRDGKPASWESTVFEYYHGAGFRYGGTGSGSWIDDEGRTRFHFGKPGLWRMHARHRGIGGRVTRVYPPCFDAAGVIAVSPLLDNAPPVILTSRWIERENKERTKRAENKLTMEFADIEGRVLYSDGESPAVSARILTLDPTSGSVVQQARSDALGRFQTKVQMNPQRPIDPTAPAMLVILPGRCGATLVPYSATDPSYELAIHLPNPISVPGRVTVAGKSASDWHNQFRVLAAYEGQERLGELLSVLVSPDADGDFELAGLTPGRYRVQASMDSIWLSDSVPLVVDADGVRSEPLTLDIGRPGVPSVIRFVDGAGEPVAGIEVKLARPAGPLTDLLWPTTFFSDGAGVLNLPPLEVGRHTLRTSGGRGKDSEHTIAVEELTPEFQPMELELVFE